MTLFAASNCVYIVQRSAVGNGYRLGSLQSAPPLVIQGGNFQDTDIVLPISTLDKRRFLYSFGKNFDGGSLQGIALLGLSGSIGLAQMVDSMRTSSGNGAVTFSTPLGGYRVFVTGFGMAQPDPEFNLQPFSVMFRIAS